MCKGTCKESQDALGKFRINFGTFGMKQEYFVGLNMFLSGRHYLRVKVTLGRGSCYINESSQVQK